MDLNSMPRLAPGCRLHPNEPVLLIPEGTLNLAGPSRDILACIDGKQTVASIVETLLQQYRGAPRDQMAEDVLRVLNRMEVRGVVRS